MTQPPDIDDDLLRDIMRDAYEAHEIERLQVQEGWTLRDFASRLHEDGFLYDVAGDHGPGAGQIVYYNGERYEM